MLQIVVPIYHCRWLIVPATATVIHFHLLKSHQSQSNPFTPKCLMLSWQTLRTAYEQEQRNQVIDWLFSFCWMFLVSQILSNERTLSLSVSLSLKHTHAHIHKLSLSLSVKYPNTHTHTHTLSLYLSNTDVHALSLSLSLSQTRTCAHTNTHSLSLYLFKFPMLILILIFRLSLFLTMKLRFIWLECVVPHRIQVRGNRLRTLYPLIAVRTTFPAHSTMLLRMLC